jgi:hypothetical protein
MNRNSIPHPISVNIKIDDMATDGLPQVDACSESRSRSDRPKRRG